MITLSIDLSKVDKSKIITGKNGGKYLNIVVVPLKNSPDQYGNTHTVYLSQSKEERDSKAEKIYVGKGKEINFTQTPPAKTTEPANHTDWQPNTSADGGEVLPF